MVEIVNQNFLNNKKFFYQVSSSLKTLLGENVPINHVGSTAIPNIVGKNILDVLVGATNKNQFNEFSNILTNNTFLQAVSNEMAKSEEKF